ncbi:MAG TPA: hypothetical protein VGN35_11510 [Jatrophihabitantaceae bacterium]|jgi:hypothetical protein|nr:hypothetical protein [Jatrophihabitantaceae bacterium]
MSIATDIRSYADNALAQGKQVIDQAQENVSGLTTKATDAVTDLRTQAEKAVNLDAIKTAVEPYLAQAKGYSTTVTDRAEELFNTVKNDKRVALVVTKAEEFTGTVVETVQERIVKPVQSLTGLGGKSAKSAPKPTAAKAAPKPVAATTARKAPAKKASAKA